GLGALEGAAPPARQSELLEWLRRLGLPTSRDARTVRGVAGCLGYYRELGERRSSLPYQIDGVVYKLDDRADQERLGFVSRAPRRGCDPRSGERGARPAARGRPAGTAAGALSGVRLAGVARRGRGGGALHRRLHLQRSAPGGAAALREPPRARHRGSRREDDRAAGRA